MKWKVIRYWIVVICVLTAALGFAVSSAYADVRAKFSPGGTWVTISSPSNELFIGLDIIYCDGSVGNFDPTGNRILRGDFTYIDSKPIASIAVYTVDNSLNPLPNKVTRFDRECSNPTPLDLSCKLVELDDVVHRNSFPFISIRTQKSMTSAYLKFSGYDEILISERPVWNSGVRTDLTLEYRSGTGLWQGNFPAMFLPVGEHKDVVLIVRDEFGQQGKCRVGDLTVLP